MSWNVYEMSEKQQRFRALRASFSHHRQFTPEALWTQAEKTPQRVDCRSRKQTEAIVVVGGQAAEFTSHD